MAAAPEATVAVLTRVLTPSVVHRTLVLICAVRSSVKVITFTTSADKTSICVFTEMVARVVPTAFVDILTCVPIGVDLVSSWTDAFVAAMCVETFVAASSPPPLLTFINIHARLSVRMKGESSWTAADRTLWGVITATITPSVIHPTRSDASLGVVAQRVLVMATADRSIGSINTSMLASTIASHARNCTVLSI